MSSPATSTYLVSALPLGVLPSFHPHVHTISVLTSKTSNMCFDVFIIYYRKGPSGRSHLYSRSFVAWFLGYLHKYIFPDSFCCPVLADHQRASHVDMSFPPSCPALLHCQEYRALPRFWFISYQNLELQQEHSCKQESIFVPVQFIIRHCG